MTQSIRRMRAALTVVLLGLALSGTSVAQTAPGSSPIDPAMAEAARGRVQAAPLLASPMSVLPGPVDPETYLVGPGDVLQLAVWGKVSRNEPLEVGPEGTLFVPGAGVLKVAGLTLAEASRQVIARMRTEVRDLHMDVRLLRARRFIVNLTGEVKNTGPVEVTATSRVSDVLPAAVLKEGASRRRVEVLGRDGGRRIADLDLFYLTGDAALNPYLRDGDVVQVPVATEFVFVAGAVARPGRFELGPLDSLRTLLRIAGDPLPSASEDRALLVRWPQPFQAESLWIGLGDVYRGLINPPLRDGERLYLFFVPQYHEQREAVIEGEVSRPGAYPIHEGRTRLTDLVEAAGGFLGAADLASIRIKRVSSDPGEADPEFDRLLRLSRDELTSTEYEKLSTRLAGLRAEYRIDWNRMLQDRESLDLLLRNGDVVRVERLVSSIRVDGEVRRPGILEFRTGISIEDYIKEAGGYSNRAWKGKVRVTRSVTGQTLLAKDVTSLDPGDFVWVPEKPDRSIYQPFRELLTTLALMSTIVIAVWTVNN